jgi:hypothetical protein
MTFIVSFTLIFLSFYIISLIILFYFYFTLNKEVRACCKSSDDWRPGAQQQQQLGVVMMDWAAIGADAVAAGMWRSAPGLSSMLGPLHEEAKVRRVAQVRVNYIKYGSLLCCKGVCAAGSCCSCNCCCCRCCRHVAECVELSSMFGVA